MLHSELRLGGRYRLDARIGAGGMGEVWRAVDEVLGRVVAVKAMLPEVAGEAGFAKRFLVEAKAMASVNHPAVASIHDYGHSDGITFLVMEFIDGASLAQLLARRGRLASGDVMRVVAQAADGLQAVHDCGIVHRDIKPANLLIRRNGALLITDFGISRTQGGTQLTATGAMLGTPTYLSPEQVLGQPATAQSDVYSLGLVAYECLAGRRPFEGENPFAVALQRIRVAPQTLGGDIPPSVLAVVEGALAVEPAHRWPSAAALADAARSAATDAADRRTGPGTVRRQGPPPPPGSAPPFGSPSFGSASQQGSPPGAASPYGSPSFGPASQQGSSPGAASPYGSPSPGPASPYGSPSSGSVPPHGSPSLGSAPQGSPSFGPVPPPGPPRRRRRLVLAGVAMVAVAVGVTVWMTNRDAGRGDRLAAGADPAPSSETSTSSTTAPVEALFEQAGLTACDGGFCPATPMCWGGLVSFSGRSESPQPVDCAEPHYWETFVAVEAPADVAVNDEDALMERPEVASTCSAEVMSSHSRDPARTGSWEREAWLITVPDTDARLLHCIASSEEGELPGSVFAP